MASAARFPRATRRDSAEGSPLSGGSELPDRDTPRLGAWLGACLAGLSLLWGLHGFDLQEPDEGRYADVAAGMVRTGDWLLPRLNGIEYFSKPPLGFWAAALSVWCFGLEEWVLRLPSALAGLATVLLVFHWSSRTVGRRAGLLAAILLATTPLFVLITRAVMVDSLLTWWITLALYSAWRVFEASPQEGRADSGETRATARGFSALFWASCALAFLTKGPIGVVLPLAAVGGYALWSGRLRDGFAFVRPLDLLLFVGLAAPWYAAVCLTHPDYAERFFLQQNVERFTTGGPFRRQRTLWYYVPVLLVALLPWSLTLPWVARDAIRSVIGRRGRSLGKFLIGALVLWFGVLCLAQSKLAYYLLPLLPLLAIGVAAWLDQRIRAGESPLLGRRWAGAALLVLASVLSLVAVAGFAQGIGLGETGAFLLERDWPPERRARLELFLRDGVLAAAIGLGGLALGLWWARAVARRGRSENAVLGVACGMAVLLASVPYVVAGMGPVLSVRPLAEAVQRSRQASEPVLVFGRYPRGLPFYLQENVFLWDAREGEFGHVLEAGDAEGRCLQGDESLLRKLVESSDSVLVVADELHDLELYESISGFSWDIEFQQGEWILARTTSRGGRSSP